ncbi:3-deoxy-D-manno-octulosonic acid transferase [Cognatishimia sp.]|uniref:3-deoxy-D-manno-octulosonic acid transferase n=1 Tax=Cognatishimia sp. TaxID=2211648 RepID=UPI003512C8DD
MKTDADAAPLPMLYRLYTAGAQIASPILDRMARKKLQRAGVSKARLHERAGVASQERPLGKLLWIHAVSVGETLSILDVIKELRQQAPRMTVLLTTTTTTSAELASKRLPEGCIHQFAPLDTPAATKRFLDHWQPDLVTFVESEIWPHQIASVHDAEIPLALINARLSEKSLMSWGKRADLARALFGRFSLVLCQTDPVRDGLRAFVQEPWKVVTSGDLKKSSDPLPVNDLQKARLAQAIAERPFWLASSTHAGEEEAMSAAHKHFVAQHADGLMILLPRHPERGPEIADMLRTEGWRVAMRSKDEAIAPDTQIYLADTLGETGLFYSLSTLVFIGGSFVPVGGHNPYEPAHMGCAILHGPLYANFAQAYADMAEQEASMEVADAAALGQALCALWGDDEVALLQANAKFYIEASRNIRKDVAGHLLALIAP